jgi:hypothetical protein
MMSIAKDARANWTTAGRMFIPAVKKKVCRVQFIGIWIKGKNIRMTEFINSVPNHCFLKTAEDY